MDILLEGHRAFLNYLERRVGSRAVAEDILQDAFVKVMADPDVAPAPDTVVAWFYHALKNAVIDRWRREQAAQRTLEAFARELATHDQPPVDLEQAICACVMGLATTLKTEYAEALQAIDIEGTSVKAFAAQRGISPANAATRVFRARKALKRRVVEACGICAEHGCSNCTCHAAQRKKGVG